MGTTPNRKRSTDDSLFARLREDHAHILARIGELEAGLLRPDRGGNLPAALETKIPRFLAEVQEEFASHMAAEDEVVYPAILAALPAVGASIEPLFTEHAELRQMLARLVATMAEPAAPERSEQIRVQVHDMADLLRLHIRKEESLVLRLAPQILAPEEIAAVSARLSARRGAEPESHSTKNRPKGDPR